MFLKMGNRKTWRSPGVNFRASAFITYTNDLPPTISTLSEHIPFTDDTTVIISSKNSDDFSTMSNTVLSHMSQWFTSNKLVLNLDRTNAIKFITNHHSMILKIGYDEKYVEESINTKYLGLQIYNHWKNHTDLMICKLSRSY
jgi:hypothetical protein